MQYKNSASEVTFRALCERVLKAEDLVIPVNTNPEHRLEVIAITRLIKEIREALNDS